VITEYLQACESGKRLDRQELLAQYPEVATSLRAFFDDHDLLLSQKNLADSDPGMPTQTHRIGQFFSPATQSPTSSGSSSVAEILSARRASDQQNSFGNYELLQEISRGGMGVVYKARHVKLNRIVALKMILTGEQAGHEEVLRFHSEAEAAAQLDHPGIVPIYEIGQHLGQHFYSMGFVDGPSLAEVLQTKALPPDHAAALVIKIARSVAYANSHGVIHRDLKPANILLDAEGNPRVTDFGVAKRLEGNSDLTRSGQILGTPAYMPPEQAAGKTHAIGATTDVYSLGAILYATLTGKPPFQSASPVETLMQVLAGEPTLPSQHQPGIPRGLESICLKCLEKNPAARYATAGELADDLQRFLDNEPIAARPADIGQRLRRWARREPALVAHVLGLGLILTTVQITYLLVGTDPQYYLQHTGVLGSWMVMVVILQKLFNIPRFSEPAAVAWCVLDTVYMTTVLVLAEPPVGPLLSGYALLIVACGFLLKAHLILVTCTTVLICYGVLLGLKPELRVHPHYCVMFALLIMVLGGVVTTQVRRIVRLNRHFGNR